MIMSNENQAAEPKYPADVSAIEVLEKQKNELEAQIAEQRAKDRIEVIAQVNADIAEYGLTAKELIFPRKVAAGVKAQPKYRDPVSGKTWTGRGRVPNWINPHVDRESYRIT
jgi:DNA-binding protein H-NS